MVSHPAEPIAIIGMACRFPGAADLTAFWRLLEEGGNAVSESDPGSGAGRMGLLFGDRDVRNEACRFGAFVDDIDRFDAPFFRISPVEAELLDPQQRMMLETSWLALEDAGIDPTALAESRTGVYTGISNDEYRMLVVDSSRPTAAAGSLYALSGTNLNGTSGRVSFVLGLRGPAKAVDAACASALVAVHDAVADLQSGKADLAIAAGVQAILNGRIYELRAEAMMLSPDGQCKAFDASANGYVRGEGCGVVVLKRLSEAEADGDRIWAVIRGAAVNHGGASVGLTVPHTPALVEVIETALSDAGVRPADIDYLEAHGTGTAVGDPIEIDAAANVLSRGRDQDRPLLVGSVKTNIGHLESAAGIAGLMKAALVLKKGIIPRHLHFHDPNPSLDWDRLPLQVTSEMVDLPPRGRPRLAGVNSFGISGTNAHVVVEEYCGPSGTAASEQGSAATGRVAGISLPDSVAHLPLPDGPLGPSRQRFLPLSGRSEGAVRDLAGRYLAWLDERPGEPIAEGGPAEPVLSDMAWTAGVGRSHFDYRSGAVFHDADSLRARLAEVVEDGADLTPTSPGPVAFVYTGQGSQWVGMGEALYETEPVARAVLDRCEAVFREVRGASLLDVMFGRDGGTGDLGDTAWEQPALYALECALTALWASVGVRPEVVVGHSVGEIAAAQAADVFSLDDGMRFAAARGALLSQMEPGGMAAVFAAPEQVAAAVEAHNAAAAGVGLSIAADNGAHQVVSGPVADIETIAERLGSEGIRVRRLNTAKAFHSALVDPVLDGLDASLEGVKIRAPSLTVISNLTGRPVEPGMALDADYWRRHARHPVAFASGVNALSELGVDVVVEIGPDSVLGTMARLAWPSGPGASAAPSALASLRRPRRDRSSAEPARGFVHAVAAAYDAGLAIRFEGLFTGEARRRISLPGYPFQRERHWLERPRQRRPGAGHALLGVRHESAGGGITFETEMFTSDPDWLDDHRVFGRVVMPGAVYGAMAAAASLVENGGDSVAVEDMQLHSALVFPRPDPEEGAGPASRTMQLLLEAGDRGTARDVRVFSRGAEGEWTVHVEARVSTGGPAPDAGVRVDLDEVRERLAPADVPDYYRARAATGVGLGPSFRTLRRAWAGPGEALGEVALPEALGRNDLEIHPLVLDGCFQVVGVARNVSGAPGEATYLPFGWERMWLNARLPDRVLCHVVMSEASRSPGDEPGEPPEVLTGEIRIYDAGGALLGVLSGYAVKRATRAALLSATEGVADLLYEVTWRERALESALKSADFMPGAGAVAAGTGPFSDYLAAAGVDADERCALIADLERLSWSYALSTLQKLGWSFRSGEAIDPATLRERLGVVEEHSRLFRRMFELLAGSGVVEERGGGFAVLVGAGDPLPDGLPADPDAFAERMAGLYAHGLTEIGLFRRSGAALADVLRGREDPLTLLFSSGEPTAGDLYRRAPVARAANRLLADAVRALVAGAPEGRRLRVLEVGAGTGSATASVLPELPAGRFDYTYTDISAGFFAEAEERFGDADGAIEYRPLDIERDPVEQGFDAHGYDLIIASNVLHATRDLGETLAHCLAVLAPSGHLVALENLRGLGWMDLTFGQLDGWWRFADDYRPDHALMNPSVWRQALGDAGFAEAEVLGPDESAPPERLDKGVIVARGPSEVAGSRAAWLIVGDGGGAAGDLAAELAARNQFVVLATGDGSEGAGPAVPGVLRASVDGSERESWRSLIAGLPGDLPLGGAVHLQSLDGHGEGATAAQIVEDVTSAGTSALALLQGLADSDAIPAGGVWFVTRGAQIVGRERGGELAGATLWGLGKVAALEAPHLQPRMIDLDPGAPDPPSHLADELLYPDRENHIAYRLGRRLAARLVRPDAAGGRLALPQEPSWVLAPDRDGVFDRPRIKVLPARALEPREVRVAVEATGLNFWDVFRSLGFIEEGDLGREMCGYVLEVGAGVTAVSPGDHVVGLGFGAFAAEMVTHEELVAPAPEGMSASGLATVPSAFVSAALSFDFTGLEPGERVLIHAGAGGVGLAAIQLAQAAGAEVFATASAPKQAYLRSLGVEHVFDSRTTDFGARILEATGGAGVHVVLNSLTSEGFIDASLSCLAQDGRFVEMARRDILRYEEMAAARPDVRYHILELDVLKKTDPGRVGVTLRSVMQRLAAGELAPLTHSRWPLAEAGAALSFMRAARHTGKIVLTASPLVTGELRRDRTYVVTGGLGGIGIAVAGWLAESGAGAIVLNGRRDPDPEAVRAIDALRDRGVRVEVELADVTDPAAIDAMLERIDERLPPLAGVIHSVGVLSDAALTNQTWESFEDVLWPKIVGGWHLHRATLDRDLEMFVLFSSRVGVMGNPGQANHAAANAFLDQLAAHRRALGLAGQSIAWGAWSEIGEAAEQRDRIERQRAARGGRWFTPQQGIRALERLVREDATTSVVMSMDWTVFEEAVTERPAFLDEVLSPASDAGTDEAGSPEDLSSLLGRTAAAGREEVLVSFLQQQVQAVLRLPTAPAPTIGFFDLGMDSLMAVELRNRLNRAFEGEYVASNTVVFDYPDIAALARHVAEELGEPAVGAAPAPSAGPAAPGPRPPQTVADEPIAVVGMACRFPGANDLEAFWRLLEEGADAVTDGRRDAGAWNGAVGDPRADDPGQRRGAFVDGLDRFDARFFRISPIEARSMDPRQRMLLETSWESLEDAGLDPNQLRGSRTGVYAGVGGSEYRDLIAASSVDQGYLGTTGSVTVGRVAFVLGLEGPAIPIDLACASSLAAVHQAVVGLQRHEVDLALAGGVNAVLSPSVSRYMMELGMLSPTGQSRPFDASADGYVRGEGCGVVVLKRLSDAEAAGDRVWGVVRGSAVNQNGASAALTVPNGPAQERVMEEALVQAGIQPSRVDYLEAHATGSQLGDPIELQAAASVYGEGREAGRPLLVGSVKSNIGHTESAAGMAALIKTLLAMNRGVIPPHLHFDDPNPHVEWERLPVRVTSEKTDWPAGSVRPPVAGVNAFGLSGANAHVLIEGYGPPPAPPAASEGPDLPVGAPQVVPVRLPDAITEDPAAGRRPVERTVRLLPLSARAPAALRGLAGRYLDWLDGVEGSGAGETLSDLAWSAAGGRGHFPYRAGVVFSDAEQLRRRLREVAGSDAGPDGPVPEAAMRVAFAFGGEGEWVGVGESLYHAEPVARAVLDRCDELIREGRGVSLLDVMFGRSGSGHDLEHAAWAGPATYALACALAAQWASVGIRPSVVLGSGPAGLAAAQSAGAVSVADGLRLALGSTSDEGPEDAVAARTAAAPGVTLLSAADGRAVEPADLLRPRPLLRDESGVDVAGCAAAMAGLGVDVVVEVGAGSTLGTRIREAWPPSAEAPVVIGLPAGGGDRDPASLGASFVSAVASAYEAGLDIAFAGLFAGESRRRISVPRYPFQRKRHWI